MRKLSLPAAICAIGLSVTMFLPTITNASYTEGFSQNRLEEQKRIVLLEMVDVLEEEVKLLQMNLINHLVYRVEQLEKQIAAK